MCAMTDALRKAPESVRIAVNQLGLIYHSSDVRTNFREACAYTYGPGSECYATVDIQLLLDNRLSHVPEYVTYLLDSFTTRYRAIQVH